MRTQLSMTMWSSLLGLTLAVLVAAGCAGMARTGSLRLNGNQEVPAVPTNASATTDIVVQLTKCPSTASSYSCPEILGSVFTTGVSGCAAQLWHWEIGPKALLIAGFRLTSGRHNDLQIGRTNEFGS